MWLPAQYQGRTASEFPLTFGGGGNIPSYLLKPRNQIAEIFDRLAPAIKEYVEKKRADAVANELMNMENPPRAEAVDQYGATYDPALAARQGLNSPTEPMATAPATGGADAYKAQKLYQDYISKQQANQAQSMSEYWKNKVLEAQANKYQADADDPYGSRVQRYPVTLADGSTVYVTGNEAARYNRPGRGVTAKPDPWENVMAVARGKMNGDKFEGANDGDMVKLVTPSGYSMVVPWSSYQARSQGFSGAKAFQERQAQATESPAPDLPPVTEPPPTAAKQLDAATAKAILAEAGGDKEKARQIARERGYTF